MKKIVVAVLVCCSFVSAAQKKDSTVFPNEKTDTSIFQTVEIEAAFPGGEAAWIKYIQSVLEQNIDKLSRNKASAGTCEVQFIVDKDGSTSNVEALTLKKSLLSKLLVDAIKNGPKWTPAYQHGRVVKAWRRQKVTFRLPD